MENQASIEKLAPWREELVNFYGFKTTKTISPKLRLN